MTFQIELAEGVLRVPCEDRQTVLAALAVSGTRQVAVGCRSGGCGVCRVQVLSGTYECGQMSAAQVSADDRAQGIALACQLWPRSDLRIRALGRGACRDEPAQEAFRRLMSGITT